MPLSFSPRYLIAVSRLSMSTGAALPLVLAAGWSFDLRAISGGVSLSLSNQAARASMP